MKAVVVDTNLLVLLVVGLANSNFIRKHRRLHPTYTVNHFDLLQRLLVRESRTHLHLPYSN